MASFSQLRGKLGRLLEDITKGVERLSMVWYRNDTSLRFILVR